MKYFITIIFILTIGFSNAQSELPERYRPYGPQPKVGEPLPDFQLPNITHYEKNSALLSDFKGKWLLLDFWFVNCASCIASFPKINKIQTEFKNEIDYVLVGINEEKRFGGGRIKEVYEGIRERQNLEVISAFDSILNFRWNIWSMPHIIIVDPAGIVRHITNGTDMTAEKVREMIKGNAVKFYPKDRPIPEYDITTFPGSSDDRLVYRSILTRSNGETSLGLDIAKFAKWPEQYRKDGFKVTSTSLEGLYRLAHTGKNFWFPGDKLNGMPVYSELIYETKDTAMFNYGANMTPPEYNGWYSYNLAVPVNKSTDAKFMMNIIQTDLKNVFGFEVIIEIRKMPVWELVVTDPKVREKLKTKGGEEYLGDGTGSNAVPSGFTARNIPIKNFLVMTTYYIGGSDDSLFYDATGITHNIDIEIKAIMTDMESIQKALRKNGLEFRRGLKEFSVIVIKDPVVSK